MNALLRLRRAPLRSSRVFRTAVLVVVAGSAFGAFGISAGAHLDQKPLPPIPACFSEGSGYGSCQGMAIPGGSAIVKMTAENYKDTFKLTGPAPLQFKKSVACGDLGCIYNHLDWVVGPGASVVSGCKTNTSTCEVKVAPGSTQWTAVYVRQNNDTATLYAIWNTGKKGAGTISGYVRDKVGQGVSGTAIDAYGTGGRGGSGAAVSGDQGFYSMEVPAGNYKVIPSGGPAAGKKSKYDPDSVERTIEAGTNAKADFALQGGLQITLTLGDTSVKADGRTVVKATVETTQFGKPLAGVKFSLRPRTDVTPTAAVTSGARATICLGAARIWPTGSLSVPVGSSVDEMTDKNGRYAFTLTVGTTPGTFELGVWAYDSTTGALFTKDLQDTSDDATLTLTPPAGHLQPDQLFTEIKSLQGVGSVTSALTPMTNDPGNMTQVLSQLSDDVPQLGGLAYSLVNGAAGGGAVLVYPATDPPTVNASSQVFLKNGIVLSPGLWAGNAIGSFVQGTALNSFMQKGQVGEVPTFQQWAGGIKVKGWNLVSNTATLSSQSFVYNGWPYPVAPTTLGACN